VIAAVGPTPRRQAYADAIGASDLPARTKEVCLLIAGFSTGESARAWPALSRLAREAGVTPGTVSRHTAVAEDAGYLFKQRRKNNSVLYTLTIPTAGGPLWGPPIPTQGAVPRGEKWSGMPASYEGRGR
jgi:DNA-binding transcriptional ArsR family regulator